MLLAGSLLVIAVAGVVILRSPAQQVEPKAELTKGERTISAIGQATVIGKPDSARVYFGVITKAETVAAARAENLRIIGRVQKALLALKLPDLKTGTRESRVSINYEDRQETKVAGYTVQQSFTVLINDSDPVSLGKTATRILDAGLQNGVNSEGHVEFFNADDSELRRQAMTKAVEDGLANARAYAAGAKVKITGVVDISGQDGYFGGGGHGFQGGGGFGGSGGQPSFAAGVWKVPSRVRVVCRY
jgi:uncharacterized protein YggE